MKTRPGERREPLRERTQTRDGRLFYHRYATGPKTRDHKKTIDSTDMDIDSLGLERSPYAPPSDGTCPFMRLPRELRDMVYDFATLENTYVARKFGKEPLRPILCPISKVPQGSDYETCSISGVPNIVAGAHAVNRLIFNESVPVLIRNTVFDLEMESDFDNLFDRKPPRNVITNYALIRDHITSIRLHVRTYSPKLHLRTALILAKFPRLKNLTIYMHSGATREWFRMLYVGLGHGLDWKTTLPYASLSHMTKLRGLDRLRLLLVDSPRLKHIEWWREKVEAYMQGPTTLPQADSYMYDSEMSRTEFLVLARRRWGVR